MTPSPATKFEHLHTLTGPYGTFEHAEFSQPRTQHGYCTDDVSRVLRVASREPRPDDDLVWLARSSLAFLAGAQDGHGRFRNRRRRSGSWFGPHTTEDCWGRAVWALGTCFARATPEDLSAESLWLFERSVGQRSRWPRSMAFASLGAAEVLSRQPDHAWALSLIRDAARVLDRPTLSPGWDWPEERLTYANAILPEAMMTAGSIVGDERLVSAGGRQLAWLLARETRAGHLSVTPAGGAGPEFTGGQFDQQPIEVAAMSDACLRAFDLTGEERWRTGHEMCVGWFMGDNDLGVPMFDATTGGGYDGLTADGPNLNQGAESTLAMLTTFQNARRFAKTAA